MSKIANTAESPQPNIHFGVTPAELPYKEFVCGIEEVVLKDLPRSEAEEIQGEVVHLLKTVKPPKSNLSGKERTTLRAWQQDDSLVILKADKGNEVVIWDHAKILMILAESSFKKLRILPERSKDS